MLGAGIYDVIFVEGEVVSLILWPINLIDTGTYKYGLGDIPRTTNLTFKT